jgi:hypothetical protein
MMAGRVLSLTITCVALQGCFCDSGATTLSIPGDTSVASVIVETAGLTVMVGDTAVLEAQARGMSGGADGCFVGGPIGPSSSQATGLYRWQSSSPVTVEVDDTGRLAARELGEATVRVRALQGGASSSIAVRVVPRIERLTITPRTATVAIGDTVSFLISALDAEGRTLAPVPFVQGPDPALVWHPDFRDHVVNQIRATPDRVLLRAHAAGTVRLIIRSFIYGIGRVPQDTAVLVIRAP